jgi:hypothetical protein
MAEEIVCVHLGWKIQASLASSIVGYPGSCPWGLQSCLPKLLIDRMYSLWYLRYLGQIMPVFLVPICHAFDYNLVSLIVKQNGGFLMENLFSAKKID